MADASHLEKMGRELKCPICLSLLNAAVSLTCNHVFCNSCIMKSMKSGSNCPVCKVPYGRREIRPAPHMDNLVSIYKNMEVASGINIFVTQNVPSTKLSGEQKKAEGDHICGGQETGGTFRDVADIERTIKGKQRKKSLKTNEKDSVTNPVKPSFPTKKRVQVPQYSLSETLTQPAKFESGVGDSATDGPKNSSIVLNKKLTLNEKEELVLSPFFWLREEEDIEKITQQMSSDHLMDTTPPNVPSFSDMKDTDDEISPKMTPKEFHSKPNIADLFDSEMFEWTQRACSPELCSSPTKMQVADTDMFNVIQENKVEVFGSHTNEEPVRGTPNCIQLEQGTCITDAKLPHRSSPRTKNAGEQNWTKKSNKRGRRTCERTKRKWNKINTDEAIGIHVDLKEVAETQEIASENNGNSSHLKMNAGKRTKAAGNDTGVTELAHEYVPNVSVGAIPPNHGGENIVIELPASLCRKEDSDRDFNFKKPGRNCKRIKTQNQTDFPARSKNQRPDSAKDIILKEISVSETKRNEDTIPQLSLLSFTAADNKNSDIGKKSSKHARDIKSNINLKCTRELRTMKKLKVSLDDISKDRLVDAVQEDHRKLTVKETQPAQKLQGNPEVRVLDDLSTPDKGLPVTAELMLRKCGKCEIIPSKIQCAFCHSSEVSKASGEVVHYFNGKPVVADYNGGSNIIHSHSNCTEWAPNVYFEGDIAINLGAELARSRRIKCSFCGIKGAALGCYEKSCRRSFHVPCAKSTPECRWDTDNFVILCPIHASSKLPNEISGSHEKLRKKSIPKRQPTIQQGQVSVKHDTRTSWHWNSCGSADKMILCCSALTIAEMEIVSEFEKLTGVAEFKKWSSCVTHVIASTDENGACRRTLKILMGILEGKWILSIDWIKACLKAMKPVNEEQYEISLDIHGIRDGPRHGRLRLTNKQPKLFDRIKFYFSGDFISSYKGYLQDLVTAAGGIVLHRKPVSKDPEASSTSPTFVIYSLELPEKCDPSKKNLIFNRRRSDAEALASSTGAKVASNTWVLNSIAACKLQDGAG